MIGERRRAMLDGISEETELLLQARLESQAPEVDGHVLINELPDGFEPVPGSLLEIEIQAAHDYDLIARVV